MTKPGVKKKKTKRLTPKIIMKKYKFKIIQKGKIHASNLIDLQMPPLHSNCFNCSCSDSNGRCTHWISTCLSCCFVYSCNAANSRSCLSISMARYCERQHNIFSSFFEKPLCYFLLFRCFEHVICIYKL